MADQNQRNRIEWSESKLLDPEWLEEYRRKREALYDDLVLLNSNLYIMDKIAGFPFDLFEPLSKTFWDCIFVSMVETNVSIIYRIAIDNHKDVLTLPNLMDDIPNHLQAQEARNEFLSRRDELMFKKRFRESTDYFLKERHNHIAHFNLRANTEITAEGIQRRGQITSRMRHACELLNSLFDLISLGLGHAKLLHNYNPGITYPADMDSRTDIEVVLDRIAQDSALLNMPEQRRDFWPHYRRNLSESEMEKLNKYRKKFGLPPVT